MRAKVQGLREGASTAGEFFQRQEEYLKKVQKSQKLKAEEDKRRLAELHAINGKRTEGVALNLKDIK